MKRTNRSVALAAFTALAATLIAGCGGARSVEAYCGVQNEYKDRYLESMELATAQLEGEDFLNGLVNGASAIGDLNNMWKEMAEVAPDEIQADTEAVSEYWSELSETSDELLSNPLGGLTQVLTGAFALAGPLTRVDEFVRANCDA